MHTKVHEGVPIFPCGFAKRETLLVHLWRGIRFGPIESFSKPLKKKGGGFS